MPRLRRRPARIWLIAIAAFVICAGLLAYGLIGSARVELKQYTYTSPDIPPAFDGMRIVLLTDIHRGPFFSQKRVGRIVERANALAPDLVLLGGDYVYGNTDYEDSCFSELAKLDATWRFAVLGNHDYGEPQRGDGNDEKDPALALKAIEASGIEPLDDRGVWLEKDGDRIRLGGVSDYQEAAPDVGPTLEGTTADGFVLLLSHNPDYAEDLPADEVDLVLSGHTHGGQITLFGRYAPYLPSDYGQKYRTGVVENGTTTVIVSNGIGSSIVPPVRFFAPPQIVEITLRRGGSTD